MSRLDCYAMVQQQQQYLQLKWQALMHQAMLQQQQQPMYHPGLITAMSQMEPIPSGNLPPGFDATSCRSVWVVLLLLSYNPFLSP
jgi:nucleolysin TIA-1/TIAR